MAQIYKKNIERERKLREKEEYNNQQQLAPPPYPSPKGRGVKCEVPLVVSILFAISG